MHPCPTQHVALTRLWGCALPAVAGDVLDLSTSLLMTGTNQELVRTWGGYITWAGVIGQAQHAGKTVQAVPDRNVNGLTKYPVALLSIRYHLQEETQ